jgi:hypothetical protein
MRGASDSDRADCVKWQVLTPVSERRPSARLPHVTESYGACGEVSAVLDLRRLGSRCNDGCGGR